MSIRQAKGSEFIRSESALRKVIPAYPKILDKRIIQQLDAYCFEIIGHSSLAVFACSDKANPIEILQADQLVVLDEKTIKIEHKLSLCKDCEHIFCSLYFLVPGVGHGLRVNGRLVKRHQHTLVEVCEVYTHCARAIARSNFWSANDYDPFDLVNPELFVQRSPYLLLKTVNDEMKTELSPRGDQAGFVKMLDPETLFIPERPGNKVAISLRNVIDNPIAELLMLVPGSATVMRVRARAKISRNCELLEASKVRGKKPLLGILLEDCQFEIIKAHDAILNVSPWTQDNQISEKAITRFPKVLSAHMNGEGFIGKVATPIVSKIVKNDLNKLY